MHSVRRIGELKSAYGRILCTLFSVAREMNSLPKTVVATRRYGLDSEKIGEKWVEFHRVI